MISVDDLEGLLGINDEEERHHFLKTWGARYCIYHVQKSLPFSRWINIPQ
jgi:hypothetical protein